MNITRKLSVVETGSVEFTPTGSGEISFACGMNMIKGNFFSAVKIKEQENLEK